MSMKKVTELIIEHGQPSTASLTEIQSWFQRLDHQIPVACIDFKEYDDVCVRLFSLSDLKYATIKTVRNFKRQAVDDHEIFIFPATRDGLTAAAKKLDDLCQTEFDILDHACNTGDCDHQNQNDCDIELAKFKEGK